MAAQIRIETHDQNSSEETGPVLLEGPGRRLREAREHARMSINSAAAHLRLEVRAVEALEQDDYDRLPEATFVRGYLRNYARLLNLPTEEVILSYNRYAAPPPVERQAPRNGVKQQVRSTDWRVRWATYAIVGVLIVLPLVWWENEIALRLWKSDEPGAQTASTAAAEPPAESSAAGTAWVKATAPEPAGAGRQVAVALNTVTPAPTTPAAERKTTPVVAESAPEPAVPDHEAAGVAATPVPAAPEPLAAPAAAAGAPERDAPTPAPAVEAVAAAQAPTEPPPAPPAAAPSSSPASTAATGQVAASGGATLMLAFSDESWVEVSDASGRRLVYGLVPGGVTRTATGESPIRVVLGNAPAVAVEVNGEPFNHADYKRGKVARFTVGGGGT
jgi:cytoskeleton protein RodZ